MDFYRPPALQAALDALGSVNRALRAWKFYPLGHPSRKSSIKQAHAAMLSLLDGNNLSLNSGRTDFSFPDGESLKDSTRMSSRLSYELFIRRVQKVTFLHDLHLEDLLDFLRLLTIPPEAVQKAGGMDKLMVEHGIRTIWVNEFDLSIISSKRREVEFTGKAPQGLDEIENGSAPEESVTSVQPVEFVETRSPVDRLHLLLGRLTITLDDDLYLTFVRQAIACCDAHEIRQELAAIFPLIELLTEHANDPARGDNLRECARFGLEQLALGEGFLAFMLDRIEQDNSLSQEAALAILTAAGPMAVGMTVEKMGTTDNLAVRKTLSTLLVGLGTSAVSHILKMMGDSRWYIVRNLAAILGDIGARDAVPELQKCLLHADVRVCKEAIRSLAKIGGREAETAIIEVLRRNDPAVFPQVIASLGGMKSRRALVELMSIVCRFDPFLKSLPLKIEALAAIALIGDRQVVPFLAKILASRHMLVPGRWKQFKIAIVNCLARLGDTRALPALMKKAARPGELGRACAEAVETIERTGGEQHGVA
ncbi:MAG: HEAT repeat domain-containing protein [Geobacteraceae bacterium]|nr:HEAT repeat domain-containing protein [Geobacteraceae bacterium]